MKHNEINTEWFEQFNDCYCIVKNKENGFYWVINLNDHPNSFLLDHSFQNMITPGAVNEQESMVVIQPNFS
jgi:hypothetical protein